MSYINLITLSAVEVTPAFIGTFSKVKYLSVRSSWQSRRPLSVSSEANKEL